MRMSSFSSPPGRRRLEDRAKGVGRFTVEIEGKAAHAGVGPSSGASAILELAHQVLKIHALNDPKAGTTLNVGVVRGGTASNVVAARAVAEVDVRVTTLKSAIPIEQALRSLEPAISGTRVKVEGRFNRPPWSEHQPLRHSSNGRARSAGSWESSLPRARLEAGATAISPRRSEFPPSTAWASGRGSTRRR